MNISGRLTSQATVSKTTSGKEVVNFTVAVSDGYKNKQGQWIDNTEFVDCAYWKNTVVASWLKQGLFVELSGQISARAWTGKDGLIKAGLNFNTSSIKPVWGTASPTESVQDSKQQETTNTAKEEEKDDLPF
ncbi:single-stranded DNA-binding protein [Sphingobacterium sp. Ag1]|uniref:single-stranded DNA-binding protein n=1 Tax=Sphingobacterium sp. Ag1 TaxID=1643451 RepID=UPI000627EA16|nr:single-stranded DNA-binding protein [Sphingobacterium sp. Ag1]KKO89195.1 single-stranded DNA-binding protein [Sphingobacterium sp. Ag1]